MSDQPESPRSSVFPHTLPDALREQPPAPPAAKSTPPGEPLTTPKAPPTATLSAQVGRHRIEGEIGHGGMGLVLRAVDPDFHRTLAVKVLLADHKDNPDLERRFLEEAQLTAQLQHPGIPPVHELGRLGDGRPFFTMKLVRGRTLAELLKERVTPADDLPRFLGIFGQICQTIGYAHARGILHR